MKIYLMHKNFQINNPLDMNESYKAINKIKAPQQCKDQHLELIDNFKRLTVQQINKEIGCIAQKHEDYKAELIEIMKKLKSAEPEIPEIIPDQVLDKQLAGFEDDFQQYKGFQKAKEALYKNDILGASTLIITLMGKLIGKHSLEIRFCEMYALIIKAKPDFKMSLSEDQVFSTFAPNQLKNSVSELFLQLKEVMSLASEQSGKDEKQKGDFMSMVQLDESLSKIIAEKLEEIFFEDARYNKMLIQYLTESTDYASVLEPFLRNIKSLKSRQKQHLEIAFSQFESKRRGPQRIAEFMAVDIDMDLPILQKDICEWYQNSQKLNGNTITLVLYDLIKKRCPFEKFINLLSQKSTDKPVDMLFTQQFFLSYLLNNSDTYLRTMIIIACSFFMPLPLVSYQPKQQNSTYISINIDGLKNGSLTKKLTQGNEKETPLDQVPMDFLPYVYEELFYCFEKKMAVLAFKVSANPNKSPQGCTSLTNYVFNRTFQTHSKSLVNFGSIEIQFDYNFEQPMFVPVADAHGLVEQDILEQVYPMFNIFLIHCFIGAEHEAVVRTQINKISKSSKDPLIFLIIHDEGRKDSSFSTSQEENIIKIQISRFNDLLDFTKDKLRATIVNRFLQHVGDFKAYESDITARLNSLQEFTKFTIEFRAFRNKLIEAEEVKQGGSLPDQIELIEALDIISNFLSMIEQNKEMLRSDKVLTMNVLFEEACDLDKQLISKTSLQPEECEKHRDRVKELYLQMKQQKLSPLTEEVRKIIDHQNYLGLTSVIAKLIKSFLNFHLQPLLKEREDLRLNVKSNPNDDVTIKKIGEITKRLEKSWYSNEFLYREYYISEMSKLRGTDQVPAQPFTDYLSLAALKISQGQPFEIIDGNNHQFIKEVYQRIETDRMLSEEILVVSVMGPQGSGKSFLLNTLFGAQFLSSAGRCTRGIYGCLIDIKSGIKKTHFKKILILDSEGIHSTEAIDEAFDKRVVFYLLCVSHIVLICNKGEMNKQMEDTIKLATDCILQVREKIDQQAQVNIIMNFLPDIKENSLYQTVQRLSDSLIQMKSNENLRQTFTIDRDNVFLLSNAFANTRSDDENYSAKSPSYQFANQVDQIRNKIITFMQQSTKKNTASYTLETWFQYAQKFWEFTDSYAGLTEYTTLEERDQDIILFKFTKELIAENFEDALMIIEHEKKINEGVDQVLAQHKGFDQTNINIIKSKIDQILYPRIQQVEKSIFDKFGQFIDEKKIRLQIKKRRYEQLDTQIRQHFLNWQQIVQKRLDEFNQKKSKFIGDNSLQNAIKGHILANNDKINSDEAQLIFQTEWKKIEDEMLKQNKSKKQISEQQFQDIGQLYRENSRQIINIDQEREMISKYQEKGSEFLRQYLSSQQSFFFFNSKNIKPIIEEFKEMIVKDKNFLHNKLEFFQEINAQENFDWKKVILERFNFGEYVRTLIFFSSKREKGLSQLGKRKGINEKKIEILISQIKEEAAHFNVNITECFVAKLQNLEKEEIQAFINEQRNLFNKDLTAFDESNCVQQVINKYVQAIKNNIPNYFKFRSGYKSHSYPSQMRFFDYQSVRDSENYAFQRRDNYQFHSYIFNMDPQDQRIIDNDGLQPINKIQIYFKINPEIRNEDQFFAQYLEFLIQSDQGKIPSNSKPVESALSTFFNYIDQEKLLASIQSIVLDNIFRNSTDNKFKTVDDLVDDLKLSDDPNITHKFCAIDFKTIQRIVVSVEGLISQINDDMEPYILKVSEHGIQCLHQIAQTYIIRIMEEVIRLTEQAPLLTLIKTKNVQRDLFIAKLTSNDKEMDIKLAERTARYLASIIVKQVKDEEIKAFQDKIECEQNLFKLKTIIKNIETQVINTVNGNLPNPFLIDSSSKANWILDIQKMAQGAQKQNISQFKNVDVEPEFSPEEIIMFYVQPSEFLKMKFNNQWAQTTDIMITSAKKMFAKRIKEINLNFQTHFQQFRKHIIEKSIQLATNVFIPQDQNQLCSQDIAQQAFKVWCQKAMAIYFGLVVTKKWTAGTAISVDDQVKMIAPGNLSLVTHQDIGVELPYASLLQESIHNELISNIDNFIQSLMSEMTISLEINIQGTKSIALQENELIGNLFQVMKAKTLGCDQMCPLCRRQCDQAHDGDVLADRIHRCEEGHQIQGFGGNRAKINNRAITYGCHELIEEDMVVWHGNDMKWKRFKEVLYYDRKWDLEDKNQGAKQYIKEKNMKIWNLTGPFICDYYRLGQHINIYFKQAYMDAKKLGSVQNTFYVLMLDKSGSMTKGDSNGQSRWGNLKLAVSQFITTIETNNLKNNSKVSIITYNSEAEIEIEAQIPSQSILSGLKSPNGGTDFNSPLNMAKDLMEKYQSKFDSFVLVMMSDGVADYPYDGINNIKMSPVKSQLNFKSIAYSQQSDILKKMAQELGGTCDNILEPTQLSTAFIQMIPNLYSQ